MNKTKERILHSSLELFNDLGLTNVSQRTITKKLNISPGNLTYHFKKKEEIETILYFEMVALLDHEMGALENCKITLSTLFDFIKIQLHSFYEYRFIMLDYTQIMRTNKIISSHFEALNTLRRSQFTRYINHLIDTKTLEPEALPNEYKNLYFRIQLLSDFWFSKAAFEVLKSEEEQLSKYQEIIFQSLYPYLTANGKRDYFEYI